MATEQQTYSYRASFSKLDEEGNDYGVRVDPEDNEAKATFTSAKPLDQLEGETATVRKQDGQTVQQPLGPCLYFNDEKGFAKYAKNGRWKSNGEGRKAAPKAAPANQAESLFLTDDRIAAELKAVRLELVDLFASAIGVLARVKNLEEQIGGQGQ